MADHNIYIRNRLNSGGNGSTKKLSAKGSSESQITTLKQKGGGGGYSRSSTQMARAVNTAISLGTGHSFKALTSSISKIGVTGLIIGKSLEVADRLVTFGVDIWESNTGESMIAKNVKAGVQTVMSGGMNVLSGAFRNALITQNVIRRQNTMLEYGRELYNLNIEGTKNKIR